MSTKQRNKSQNGTSEPDRDEKVLTGAGSGSGIFDLENLGIGNTGVIGVAEFLYISKRCDIRALNDVYKTFNINGRETGLLCVIGAYQSLKASEMPFLTMVQDWVGWGLSARASNLKYMLGLRDKGALIVSGEKYLIKVCVTPMGARVLDYYFSRVKFWANEKHARRVSYWAKARDPESVVKTDF